MSHNHFAFGSVARFLTERVAGITPVEPGYRVVDIQPLLGGGLAFARASVQTPHGRVASSWRVAGDEVEYDVTIPAGTTARFRAHGVDVATLGAGRHTLHGPAPAARVATAVAPPREDGATDDDHS